MLSQLTKFFTMHQPPHQPYTIREALNWPVPADVILFCIIISLTACAWLIPVILHRMKMTIRGWISRIVCKEQGESDLLQLPPELRLQVYSHLPLSAAQSLRQTRRQLNHEI